MWIRLFFLTQLLFSPLFVQASPPHTPQRAISGYDVVNAVNDFRAQYGLPAYEIDGSLMSLAQAQSDYQASINKNTHTRPDGSGAEVVSSENIAMGYGGMVIETILRQQWLKDYAHTITLIGFSKGRAGAGVATGSDGVVYYTLDVNNTGGALTNLSVNSLPVSTDTAGKPVYASQLISKMITSTPQPDGSILHTVQYGQTLWGIATAYSIPLKDLVTINHLNATQAIINVGQQLLVHPSSTPGPTATITPTPVPPTETPSPTITPTRTPTRTRTPTPTPFLSIPSFNKLKPTETAGLVMGILGVIGLSLAGGSSLLKRKKE
jgi:LysM repeat protein